MKNQLMFTIMELNRRMILASAGSLATVSGCLGGSNPNGGDCFESIDQDCAEMAHIWPSAGGSSRRKFAVPDAELPQESTASVIPRTDIVKNRLKDAPVVANQTVFAVGQGGEAIARGKYSWTKDIDQATYISPAISCNSVLVHTRDGVVSLDWSTGERDWKCTGISYIKASGDGVQPAVAGERLYLGGDELVSINLETGSSWQRTVAEGDIYGIAATDDNVVAISAGDYEPFRVTCYEINGNEKWSAEISEHRFGPAVHDGSVYVTSSDQTLLSLDLATGEENWTTDIPVGSNRGFAVHGDHVIVACGKQPSLRAYNTEDGSLIWSTAAGGITNPPVIVGEEVVVSIRDPGEDIDTEDISSGLGVFTLRSGEFDRFLVTDVRGDIAVGEKNIYMREDVSSSLIQVVSK